MATIAVPLAAAAIQAAIPILQPAIAQLIHYVEAKFAPKTGSAKFATVLNAVMPLAEALAANGSIAGVLGTTQLGSMVETIFQTLKANGQIGAAPASAVSALPSGTFLVTVQSK